jgi:hypothetical protein
LEEGDLVIGINGLEIADVACATTSNASTSTLFSLWTQRNVCLESQGDVVHPADQTPSFNSPHQVIGRSDAYFGVVKLDVPSGPTFLWHCSSMVSDTFFAKSRGAIIQLAGLAEVAATSSSSGSADARGSTSCVMAFPTPLLLQGDQGAHNSQHVFSGCGDEARDRRRTWCNRGDEPPRCRIRCRRSARHFKFGVQIYSLEAPVNSSVYSFKQRRFLIGGRHWCCWRCWRCWRCLCR